MRKSSSFRRSILLFCLAGIIAANCRRNPEKEALPEIPESFADFPEFYDRFHVDSAFQMAHIQWPLQGLASREDPLPAKESPFYWQPETWVLHRPVNYENSDFIQEFTPFGEDILIEQIVHKMGDFGMVRRWSRQGDEWYLIYYAERKRDNTPSEGELKIEGGF